MRPRVSCVPVMTWWLASGNRLTFQKSELATHCSVKGLVQYSWAALHAGPDGQSRCPDSATTDLCSSGYWRLAAGSEVESADRRRVSSCRRCVGSVRGLRIANEQCRWNLPAKVYQLSPVSSGNDIGHLRAVPLHQESDVSRRVDARPGARVLVEYMVAGHLARPGISDHPALRDSSRRALHATPLRRRIRRIHAARPTMDIARRRNTAIPTGEEGPRAAQSKGSSGALRT